MVDYYSVSSYDEFVHELTRMSDEPKRVLTFFCGALGTDGQSWCSDCRNALPVIQNAIEIDEYANLPLNYVFVSIPREEWKNLGNYYRTDKNLQLTNIPTLICWEQGKQLSRLVEKECSYLELVKPFFKSKKL